MEYGVIDILTLIGSLGLFLFGMKMMSDGLQRVAGDRMRKILGRMTSNRIKGVFTGFFVTTAIQSSSATTVMVVSFVNAGLLSLIGAIGVIMGANIGTTVTAWLISLLGLSKVSISAYALPIIAFSFPFVFSKKKSRQSWGELIIGFAILFIGLQFLKESVPDLKNNPDLLNFVKDYANMGFLSTLIFLGIGTLLTVIIQSSSATMALTLVMCNSGWISYDLAAAMVLGENIGTTITANLASLVANVSAKRAARAHFIFNMIGVIWMLVVFKYFLQGIDWLMELLFNKSATEDTKYALSLFHTVFNILNTLLLIGFAPLIARLVTKLVSAKDKEKFRLKHIDAGYYSTDELGVVQAKKEIAIYSQRSKTMFEFVKQLFNENDELKFEELCDQIEKYEKIGDNMEIEVASYLAKISEGELSMHASTRVRAMHKIIDNLESIFDASHNIGRSLKRKKQNGVWFTQDLRDNMNKMFGLIDNALSIMINNLEGDYDKPNIEKAVEAERKINEFRDKLRSENIENLKNGKYKQRAGIIYNDIFSYTETLGDHIINVSEAINTVK